MLFSLFSLEVHSPKGESISLRRRYIKIDGPMFLKNNHPTIYFLCYISQNSAEKHEKTGPEVWYRVYLENICRFWSRMGRLSTFTCSEHLLTSGKIAGNLPHLRSKSLDFFGIYSISHFGTGFFVFFGTVLTYVAQKTNYRMINFQKHPSIYFDVTPT